MSAVLNIDTHEHILIGPGNLPRVGQETFNRFEARASP
jgi:hypothetical protein